MCKLSLSLLLFLRPNYIRSEIRIRNRIRSPIFGIAHPNICYYTRSEFPSELSSELLWEHKNYSVPPSMQTSGHPSPSMLLLTHQPPNLATARPKDSKKRGTNESLLWLSQICLPYSLSPLFLENNRGTQATPIIIFNIMTKLSH